jgi:hypothetical protein
MYGTNVRVSSTHNNNNNNNNNNNTCLSTMHKTLTGIITRRISVRLEEHNLPPADQKDVILEVRINC